MLHEIIFHYKYFAFDWKIVHLHSQKNKLNIMNKLAFATLIVAGLLGACGNNSTNVEATEAQKVETNTSAAAVTFKTIKDGSHLTWGAAHLGGVEPRFGKIFAQSAEAVTSDNKLTNAKVVMDMKSFTVENFGDDQETAAKLHGHLLSGDFFNTEAFPTSTFELTKVESNEGEYNSKLTGNLTILDVTKSITFNANVNATADMIAIQSEKFEIDRTDWGLKYNVEGTEGVPADYIIANGIEFQIDVTLNK